MLRWWNVLDRFVEVFGKGQVCRTAFGWLFVDSFGNSTYLGIWGFLWEINSAAINWRSTLAAPVQKSNHLHNSCPMLVCEYSSFQLSFCNCRRFFGNLFFDHRSFFSSCLHMRSFFSVLRANMVYSIDYFISERICCGYVLCSCLHAGIHNCHIWFHFGFLLSKTGLIAVSLRLE